jgi:ABC-type multidrug transport system ATPase subunit
MVLRFYDPQAGDVKIDKHYNLRDLNLRWWLRNVGVVSQEPVLFKGTLRYNILYGVADQRNITDEQIMEACRRAFLTNLIQEKGLDYDVGDKGGNLSGGQKQRVCIARVFLRQPKILLLDEVTSALDPISEAEVMKALTELMKDRTTLVIAHRLHTIVDVDRVYVLKEGRVVDQGAHGDLVSKEGFFREMWVKQQGERGPVSTNGESGVEKSLSSWADVDTLLDLLERQTPSTEVMTLARRIRPPRMRLVSMVSSSLSSTPMEGGGLVELSSMGGVSDSEDPPSRRGSMKYGRPITDDTDDDDDDSDDDRVRLLRK